MEKKEIIIGTDQNEFKADGPVRHRPAKQTGPVQAEESGDTRDGGEVEEEEEVVEPVPIADMATHVLRLRHTILLTSPVPPAPGMTYQNASITASEIERVELLDDLLDTVFYWATEESSTFLDEPSQLAEVEVPEVIAFFLFCQRPRLIHKALRITELLLCHPQTRSELHRTVRGYYEHYNASISKESEPKTTEPSKEERNEPSCGTPLYLTVVHLLERFEGLPDLVAAGTRVLTDLSLAEGAEVVLQSNAVSLVLSSVVNHVDCPTVHLSSVQFFATVVDLPRKEVSPDSAATTPAPLGVLFCHSEELLALVLQVLRIGWNNLDIKRSCLHFLRTCSRYPENRLPLLQSQALWLTLKALPELHHSEAPLVVDALDIISYGIPYFDAFQLRSVLRALHQLIKKRGEVEVLVRSVAIVYAILRGVGRRKAERHVAQVEQVATHSEEVREEEPKQRLCWSTMQWHPDPVEDTLRYVHELCFPPLLVHIADFYAPHRFDRDNREDEEEEEEEEGEEANKEEEQLAAVAQRCVQELMRVSGGLQGGMDRPSYDPYWFHAMPPH